MPYNNTDVYTELEKISHMQYFSFLMAAIYKNKIQLFHPQLVYTTNYNAPLLILLSYKFVVVL